MKEERFKVDLLDGNSVEYHFLLTSSQIELLKHLVQNSINTYDAEMTVQDNTVNYIVI